MKNYFKAAFLALAVVGIGLVHADRNGSGTYVLPAGNPVNAGTPISPTWANNTLADIANNLTDSIAKDGQTVPTANLPMGGFNHTNVANSTARNQYAGAGQVQDFSLQTLGSVLGTNTITGNLTPAITAYTSGMTVVFAPANTITDAATLNVNGVGAHPIVKADGDALISSDIVVGIPAVVVHDAGGSWFLLNPQSGTLINGVAISDLARLSQTNTFAGTVKVNNSNPTFELNESTAAADNKRWLIDASAEALYFQTLNDAGTIGSSAITINRTGTTIDTIALAGTAITLNGVASSDFARLSQNQIFTGSPQRISHTTPQFIWDETDAAANNRLWKCFATGEVFSCTVTNDADSVDGHWLDVNRTGTTADTVTLSATTVTVPAGTFNATATTVGSSATDVTLADSDGGYNFRGTQNNQTTNNSYVSFQQLGGTQNGFAGFGGTDTTLRFHNSIAGGATVINATDGPVQLNAGTSTIDLNGSGGVRANGSTVWTAGNDGAGSGLDADLLDGNSSAAFATASHAHSAADVTSGTLAIARGGTGQTDGTARNITGKAGVAKTLSTSAASGGSDGDIWYRY